ncbi:ABC transporter permease [Hallella sp.]|uniref:ABC transporter permease n=1 Tax=Hallella sp. TaxID=2980186 RepID=UPI002A920702|nr:ABC transporter permease [Hallella sp.]MDY5926185.1 ABC transporter permease [Hallella sp.]
MNISVLGLVLGLLLLALPIYIIYAFDLRLMRRLLKSLAMMAVMVSAFGAITALLMTCNILWVNLLVGVALALLSSVVVVLRSGLRQRRLLLPVMAASVAPLLLVSLYVLLLVLSLKEPFDTRFYIPMLGLMVGMASGLIARALHAYYMGLAHHNELYYYLLGNGATHREAVRHFVRRGFQAALVPVMRQMSGMFLTTAPALMLGLVMSGVGVWTAALLEVVVLLAVTVYALTTFWLAILLSRRYAFDEYERLRPMKKGEAPVAPTSPVAPERVERMDREE